MQCTHCGHHLLPHLVGCYTTQFIKDSAAAHPHQRWCCCTIPQQRGAAVQYRHAKVTHGAPPLARAHGGAFEAAAAAAAAAASLVAPAAASAAAPHTALPAWWVPDIGSAVPVLAAAQATENAIAVAVDCVVHSPGCCCLQQLLLLLVCKSVRCHCWLRLLMPGMLAVAVLRA